MKRIGDSPSCCRQNGNQNIGEEADQTDANIRPDSCDDGCLSRIKFHAPSLSAVG